jgi:hypothetical protein
MSDKSLAVISKTIRIGLPMLADDGVAGWTCYDDFEALSEAAEVFAVARLLVASFVTRGR